MSVTEVAERAEVSEGSVIGFCQTIGARGFQQIKLSLARELVQPVQFIHEDLTPDDDTAAVIEKVFQSDLQALRDTQNALDVHSLARAVEVTGSLHRRGCRRSPYRHGIGWLCHC